MVATVPASTAPVVKASTAAISEAVIVVSDKVIASLPRPVISVSAVA